MIRFEDWAIQMSSDISAIEAMVPNKNVWNLKVASLLVIHILHMISHRHLHLRVARLTPLFSNVIAVQINIITSIEYTNFKVF